MSIDNITDEQRLEILHKLGIMSDDPELALFQALIKIDELSKTIQKAFDNFSPEFLASLKGKDADPVDEQKIIDSIMEKIRQPEDGDTPEVDYPRIISSVLAQIHQPEDGKTPTIDYPAIVNEVLMQVEFPEYEAETPQTIKEKILALDDDEQIELSVFKGFAISSESATPR